MKYWIKKAEKPEYIAASIIYSILKYHDIQSLTYEDCIELCNYTNKPQEFKLINFVQALNTIGFIPKGKQGTFKELKSESFPVLASMNQNQTMVILFEIKKTSVIIGDAILGIQEVKHDDFNKNWSGIIVSVDPKPEIKKIIADTNFKTLKKDLFFESYSKASRIGKATDDKIKYICIPTHNRHTSLSNLLDSFLGNEYIQKRDLEFFISDDTYDDNYRNEVITLLKQYQGKYKKDIFYAGIKEKRDYVEKMSKEFNIDKSILEFAFLNEDRYPVSVGSNRNSMMIHSVGELSIQFDDDTQYAICNPPDFQNELELDTLDPLCMQYWFHDEREFDEYLHNNQIHDIDILEKHEILLGKKYFDAVHGFDEQSIEFSDINKQFDKLISTNPSILFTVGGHIGNSELFDIAQSYLLFQGESRKRLLESEDFYRRMYINRQLMRSVNKYLITQSQLCIGINLGLDTRKIIPPFQPVQWLEDHTPPLLLQYTHSSWLSGYIPYMINHKTLDKKPRNFSDLFKAPTRGISGDVILGLINEAKVQSLIKGESVNERITSIGDYFQLIGNLNDEKFNAKMNDFIKKIIIQNNNSLKTLLIKYRSQPDYWENDIKKVIKCNDKFMSDNKQLYPIDLFEMGGVEAALFYIKKMIVRFGYLLNSWEDIFNAALKLREQGTSIGVNVSGLQN